jgi:two-component system chemotaxis response regulator CheB
LGLRFLHHEGIFCVAQSEEDCIVYGMPREAVERGAADFVGNLDEIRTLLIKSFQLKAGRVAS